MKCSCGAFQLGAVNQQILKFCYPGHDRVQLHSSTSSPGSRHWQWCEGKPFTLPASPSSCWFQSNEPNHLQLNQQLEDSSVRKVKTAKKESPLWDEASSGLARGNQGFSSYSESGRERGTCTMCQVFPMVPREGGLPWHFQVKPQNSAEEEISECIIPRENSPLVQEVLEAQLCLRVPSPPEKPNPVIY